MLSLRHTSFRLLSVVLIGFQLGVLFPVSGLATSPKKSGASATTRFISGKSANPNATVAVGAPLIAPILAAPIFSAPPTDIELSRARFGERGFIRIGEGTDTDAERMALGNAISRYWENGEQGIHLLEEFSKEYRSSSWRASVFTNLGLAYRQTGNLTKARAAFEAAWAIGKSVTGDETQAATIDCAVSELADLNARQGGFDRLEILFSEIGNRDVRGSAGNTLNVAREKFGKWRSSKMKALNISASSALASATTTDIYDALASIPPGGIAAIGGNVESAIPDDLYRATDNASAACRSVAMGNNLQISEFFQAILQRATPPSGDCSGPGATFTVLARRGGPGTNDLRLEYYCGACAVGNCSDLQSTLEVNLPPECDGDILYGGQGSNPDDQGGSCSTEASVGGEGGCVGGCSGMARYDIQTFLVNLHIQDAPIGYSPPRGPSVNLNVTYNQREQFQSYSGYFNFGNKWTHNWMAYVTENPQEAANQNLSIYRIGGGRESATGGVVQGNQVNYAPQLRSQAVVSRFPATGAATGFERRFSDASVEVYGFAVDPPSGTSRRWFLTQLKDAEGNTVTLNYNEAPYDVNSPGARLTSVIDAIGQRTTLDYPTTGTDAERLRVSRVTDPFGRFAQFAYDASGRLQKITDVVGIESAFAYGGNDFITSLTTPYGTTNFNEGVNPNDSTNRWIEVTDPLGQKERVEFRHNAPGLAGSDPLGVPTGIVGAANQNLAGRNTFYWDKKAYADFYTAQNPNYEKAHITHWLEAPSSTPYRWTSIMESEKAANESRVWFRYPNQSSPFGASGMTTTSPAQVGRVLDNGAGQVTNAEYNAIGKETKSIDPVGRETIYEYSTDGIDLLAVKQRVNFTTPAVYETLATNTFNSKHLPLTATDAAGKTTTYTYNSQGQPLTVTNAKSETMTFAYNSDGYLFNVTGAQSGATTTYEYRLDTNGKVLYGTVWKVTDSEGYVVATDYDNLDRPIKTTYPDATYREMSYIRPSDSKMTLDVWSVRDRQGRITNTVYDSLRRVTSVTDPQNRTAIFDWCNCGGLFKMTDAKGQVTQWNRDLQGRVTEKILADGAKTTFAYETTTSRLKLVTDPRNQRTNYVYYKDNNLQQLSYTDTAGQPLNPTTPTVTNTYDQFYNRMTSMTDGIGTTNYAYHPVSTTQLGAGQLASVDGPLVNDTISYTYDELGRALSRSIGSSGNVQTHAYDNLGRTTSVVNALGTFTFSYDGVTGRVFQVLYPNSQKVQMTYDNNLGDRRMLAIHNKDGANATISRFDYTYSPEGNITTWTRQAGSETARTETFTYDNADQLIGAILKEGATTIRQTGYAYDLIGNRTQESRVSGTGFPQTTDYETIEWDAEKRIAAVVKGTRRSEFSYDGAGHRVRIVEKEGAVTVSDKRYIWCSEMICEERDGTNTGTVLKKYFGAGVKDETTSYFYAPDHLGSIREVTDSSGNLISRFDYDTWGRQTQSTGTYKPDWGYTGSFYHKPSGLVLTTFRGYDPNLGRWISRDPIGINGGVNLYSYVKNNPINAVDPDGLFGRLIGMVRIIDVLSPNAGGTWNFDFTQKSRRTKNFFKKHPVYDIIADYTLAKICYSPTKTGKDASSDPIGYVTGDDRGHIIGAQLGGRGSAANLFSQDRWMNQNPNSPWRQYEDRVRNYLDAKGSTCRKFCATLAVELLYQPQSQRPYQINAEAKFQDGHIESVTVSNP